MNQLQNIWYFEMSSEQCQDCKIMKTVKIIIILSSLFVFMGV